MILTGRHRQDVLAVDHYNKAGFFAVEELFNYDAMTRVAKRIASQHVMYGGFGFFQRHCDNHTLTGSQTVSLDDDRRAFLTQISEGRFDFGKVLIFGCRDLVTRKEILGERFGTFQLCRACGWAKDFQARSTEGIDYAFHQRRFRADDRQVDLFTLGKAQQRRNVGCADRDVLQRRFQRGTGVTWCNKHGFHFR